MNPFIQFMFRPEIMQGIAEGSLKIVTTGGNPIGMVRDAVTGRFVAHAVGVSLKYADSLPVLSPLTIGTQLVTSGAQMAQVHRGFQKVQQEFDVVKLGIESLQASVGVLQGSMALIGVGTVAGTVLGAVNLHQMLKLREDVRAMRLEIKEGFLDLKQALANQGDEIKAQIHRVAEDIKCEQHRVILIEAYGKFLEALRLIRTAQLCQDSKTRHGDLQLAKHYIFIRKITSLK